MHSLEACKISHISSDERDLESYRLQREKLRRRANDIKTSPLSSLEREMSSELQWRERDVDDDFKEDDSVMISDHCPSFSFSFLHPFLQTFDPPLITLHKRRKSKLLHDSRLKISKQGPPSLSCSSSPASLQPWFLNNTWLDSLVWYWLRHKLLEEEKRRIEGRIDWIIGL